ncbi:hypothetical protein BP5796_12729 [Coleophoma crateriformis]|uniref:Uncharacterized protein n=1 Tax=Coleophoma crateriformis TaxID=565419 RepID=A0A3D8Q650_9HELO|nr:hypothetical protein BP5796_12729 [Coleophoma crateriformis]
MFTFITDHWLPVLITIIAYNLPWPTTFIAIIASRFIWSSTLTVIFSYWKTIVITIIAWRVLLPLVWQATTEPVYPWPQPSPEDAEDRVPDAVLFEAATLSYFLDAAQSGLMPGEEESKQGIFPSSEMSHFGLEYQAWAPEPWATKLPPPPGPFGSPPGVSPAAIIRVGFALSGLGDLMEKAFTLTALDNQVERSFKFIKSTVWFGMVPMSDARWQAKGLDDPDNIEEAIAVIRQVVDVFEYFRKPSIQGQFRLTHNKIAAEIDIFQDAIEALRLGEGRPDFEFNLTKIWQDYIHNLFIFRVSQSKAWAFKHLKVLFEIWKSKFLEKMQTGREISETKQTVIIDHYMLAVLDQLLTLYSDADIAIRGRTQGFLMTYGIEQAMLPVERPSNELNKIYSRLDRALVTQMKKAMQDTIQQRTRDRHAMEASQGPRSRHTFMEKPSLIFDREWGHKSLQSQIDTPIETKIEPWVQQLKAASIKRFGFVVYRLSYEEDSDKWAKLLSLLQGGLESGWEGLVGAETIRNKEMLHWIDGRQEDVPEGDLQAALKHFQTFSKSTAFPTGLSNNIFLAITPQSVASFIDAQAEQPRGDFRGWLRAVEVPNPTVGSSTDTGNSNSTTGSTASKIDSLPPYDGTIKIIDQLVWTDLYAKTVMGGIQTMEGYSELAGQHPWGVYVGPSTAVSRKRWREMRNNTGISSTADTEDKLD